MRIFNVLVLLFAVVMCAGVASAADAPPNIFVVVADDLGVEGVGCYGGLSYKTPRIDALAASGIRFTHAFANPYCSPTRGQLLTGRYPLHNGITRVIYDPSKHREFLDPKKETSFATLLRNAGYKTAIAGKWQVSFLHEDGRDTLNAHGFDDYMMWQIFHKGSKTSRFADPTMRCNGKVLHDDLRGRYGPDVQLDFLLDFVNRHRDGPFLVYYTALLPHWPWEPTPDSADPLKPASGMGDTKYMPDMVAYLDKQVGRIVDTLEKLGLRDNTLVIFTADNGTDRRITSRWTNGRVTRDVPGGKGTMTDAGTRVPLIASWPGVIEPGGVSDDLIDLSDLLPTLVEVGRAKPSPKPINGVSFAAQLRGEKGTPRRWVHIQDKDNRYARNRDYIFTNKGKLRPVVEIGQKPAKPIADPTAAQRGVRGSLKSALDHAKSLTTSR